MPSYHLPLHTHQIHLWLVDIDMVNNANIVQAYRRLLSDEERQTMASMRAAKRQHQFLIARAALRLLLSNYIRHTTPAMLTFQRNDYGKPALATDCDGLLFNISHSHKKILIGISRRRELGVDIEVVDKSRDVEKIAMHYFHPNEWSNDFVNNKTRTRSDIAAYFYKIWTLKEALIKADGKGLSIPLNSFYFNEAKAQPEVIIDAPDLRLNKQWQFYHQVLSDNYSLALAFKRVQPSAGVELSLRHFVPLLDEPETVPVTLSQIIMDS